MDLHLTPLTMQFDEKPLKEIDDTAMSAAEDRFEEILGKVKAAGARIDADEESPLYADLGMDEVEIGEQRLVQFNLNGMDFLIIRQVREARIGGMGHQKRREDLERPSIEIKLKRKPEIEDQWVSVDIDDMF